MSGPAISRLPNLTPNATAAFFPSNIGSDRTFPHMKIQCLKTDTTASFEGLSLSKGIGAAATGASNVLASGNAFEAGKAAGEFVATAINTIANTFGKVSFSTSGPSIGLYIPELQDSVDPVWTEKDLMIAGNLQEMSSNIAAGNLDGSLATAGGVATILGGKALAKQVDNITSKIGITDSATDLASFASRKTPNQKRTLLFDGMNLRTFSFSWKFIPKNEAELNAIYKIIHMLKVQSLPSLAMGKSMFTFPDPIRISFHNVDTDKFPKINECVIDNIKVNYTPDRALQLFRTGAPVSVNFDMSVKELDVIVREGDIIKSSGMYE